MTNRLTTRQYVSEQLSMCETQEETMETQCCFCNGCSLYLSGGIYKCYNEANFHSEKIVELDIKKLMRNCVRKYLTGDIKHKKWRQIDIDLIE